MKLYPGFIKRLCTLFLEITIACIAYVTFIAYCSVTFPFLLYRQFITNLAFYCDEDFTNVVTGLSAMFHRDFDTFNVKPLSSIVACLKIKGPPMNISEFQETFYRRVISRKDTSTQGLLYPKLQQKFTRFFGYTFLKWDRQFNIKSHIKLHNYKGKVLMTRGDLVELWEDLMVKPYSKNRSPWEILVIDNCLDIEEDYENKSPDWIFFLRIHHSIADGFSFQKILSSLFQTSYEPNFVTKATPVQQLLLNVRSLLLGPYDLAYRIIRHTEDYHALHIPADQHSKRYFIVESPLISVKDIRSIKQHFSISFTCVLVEMLCGGLRKYLMRRSKPIPELLTVGIPFPAGERTETLGNEFYIAPVDLPMTTPHRQERLKNMQNQLNALRYSSFMKMLSVSIRLLSNLPSPLLRFVTRKSIISTSYSTLPGPDIAVEGLNGRKLIEANFTHGMSSDSLGLCFSSISFNGFLRVTIFVEENLIECRENAKEIVNCIMEDYTELQQFLHDTSNKKKNTS